MKTREWTVRALDIGIARLEGVWGSLFVHGEFYNLLKTFGLINIDTQKEISSILAVYDQGDIRCLFP